MGTGGCAGPRRVLARAQLHTGQRGVDVRGIDDARAGQHREDRQVGAEVDGRGQKADGQERLQVGLLVDGKQPACRP